MFWAVQGMAAELATGVLVMRSIAESGTKIFMLVQQSNASFHKKAKGKIRFSCDQQDEVKRWVQKAISDGQGHKFWLQSEE